MEKDTTAIERAFQLAKSGRFASMLEVRKALKEEGYSLQQLEGKSLQRQLRDIMSAARDWKKTKGRF
jgi:hypothetical protein